MPSASKLKIKGNHLQPSGEPFVLQYIRSSAIKSVFAVAKYGMRKNFQTGSLKIARDLARTAVGTGQEGHPKIHLEDKWFN